MKVIMSEMLKAMSVEAVIIVLLVVYVIRIRRELRVWKKSHRNIEDIIKKVSAVAIGREEEGR